MAAGFIDWPNSDGKSVADAARSAGLGYVWLITTNDNERARAWYGQRGFDVVLMHEGAAGKSRGLKPEISLVNPENGVAIRDEIEMRRPVERR
jgi:ribosomal protein S18 acetylase RimI-like enzyme